MTDRLTIYRGALMHLGERRIASLSENTPAQRYLDEVWDQDFINLCLDDGQWVFATRSLKLDADSGIEPAYGHNSVIQLPDDYVNTIAICSDEYYKNPIINYDHEGNYIASDCETIYIKYVSSDDNYGGGFNNWSPSFLQYVTARLAYMACIRMTQSNVDEQKLMQRTAELRKIALNKDMQKKPSRMPAPGRWVRSRHSGFSEYGRGNGRY